MSGADTLAALRDEERAALEALGFDAGTFASLVDGMLAGTLPSNRVQGRVEPPGPIDPLDEDDADLVARGEEALASGRVGLLLLNGGMASRFGGRVKGVVDALPGRSFLSLQAARLRELQERTGRSVPMLLMNSEATDGATQQWLSREGDLGVHVRCFLQSGAPRIRPDGSLYRDAAGALSIYGPGHGDLLPSLRRSGLLAALRAEGVELLLMANVDNLGAALQPALLGALLRSEAEMLVEVAPKRPGDVGGAPASVDGRVQLVEGFAFPEGFAHARIPVFNTNTLWFRTAALERSVPLRWYEVRKEVHGAPVVQFERLVGQATWALRSAFVTVPRSRFLPVKSRADLRAIQPQLEAMFSRR